jgi:hypothetical protein
MNMDPHSLADALMDPMMMMLGTMIALSGAYIAIAMQVETIKNFFTL